MKSNQTPNIFLSYSWANTKIADEIDDFFKSIGITLRRDRRDIEYKGSIKEFMQNINDSDYSLLTY